MKETLRTLFQQKFNPIEYRKVVLENLLHAQQMLNEPQFLEETNDGDRIYGFGYLTDADGKQIGLYYTDVVNSDVRRKRVGFRQMMKSYVKYGADAAIAVFADKEHWRLSYMSDLKGGETSAKRFSYILGDPNGQYNTPVNRLALLGTQAPRLRLKDIFEAFSVETLSKEFFDGYHRHYDTICGYLTKHVEEFSIFNSQLSILHDYVKKMMGRIIFLHFLQKKGWLNGNHYFLRDLYFMSPYQADFLEQVLEPLFFGIFNTETNQRERLFADEHWDKNLLAGWKNLPYLNGGLFERDTVDKLHIKLPGSLYEDLFTFLASYNFTVDENDPDDAEVGVDPEMLGKIFESLLEDNKAKGAFYTPKEIVRYMCKESLIAYLSSCVSKSPCPAGRDLANLINSSDSVGNDNRVSLTAEGGNNLQDSQDFASETSRSIRRFVEHHEMQPELEPYREVLDTALRNVKICDPAIGSGAFPMGLLNELWRCREALYSPSPAVRNPVNLINSSDCVGNTANGGNNLRDSQDFARSASRKNEYSRSQLKKEIIENNIYGVDIERGAIDIARLRFWLSIVVDAEEPEPLPNFDYKFMQGNSLIESFEGFDLSRIAGRPVGRPSTSAQLTLGLDTHTNQRNLHRLIKEYFRLTNHQDKANLRKQINEEVKLLIINSLGTDKRTQALLEKLDVSANQDFFLWHTWFKDIFEKGGFDIVIGNPPYNGISQNNGESIKMLIEDYKKEPSTQNPLGERKLWLQDDYVKFIRKMESFIETSPKGILAFINNSSFIDNPTFRGMRWHLLNTFDSIVILDLHGNTRKSNVSELGVKDENVFNIMQGVSINVFQKKSPKRGNNLAEIIHTEIVGTRKHKKEILNSDHSALHFRKVSSISPFFFFFPQNRQGIDVYERGFAIQKLMPVCVTGIVTARDGLVIDIRYDDLVKKIEFFADTTNTDDEVRDYFWGKKKSSKYLPGDSRGWSLVEARQAILKHNIKDNIIPLAFRVLDNRFVYYSSDMVDWGREDIYQKHILQKDNYCLVVPRQTTKEWRHVFVTNKVANFNFLATGGQNGAGTHFPLYLYDAKGNRTANISNDIWSKINNIIGYETSAEELLDYVYGILHSKKYRMKYMEFLKKDFPRIPYPKNVSYYQKTAEVGRKLRVLHLFNELPPEDSNTSFDGTGDNVISKVQFHDNKIFINNQQFFNNIPDDVWLFEIGDDQPAKRWLKERKGIKLQSEDIAYYQQLLYVLFKTKSYMNLIENID